MMCSDWIALLGKRGESVPRGQNLLLIIHDRVNMNYVLIQRKVNYKQ
jgi:hypothetical protein